MLISESNVLGGFLKEILIVTVERIIVDMSDIIGGVP